MSCAHAMFFWPRDSLMSVFPLESDLVDRLDHPPVRGRRRAASEPDVDVRFADLAVPREVEHAALLRRVVLQSEIVAAICAVGELRGRRGARAALLAGERPLETWIRDEMPALDTQAE